MRRLATTARRAPRALAGSVKPFQAHVLVALEGPAAAWPPVLEAPSPLQQQQQQQPALELLRALRAAAPAGLKLTGVEARPEAGILAGDALIFPRARLLRRPASAPDVLAALEAADAPGALAPAPLFLVCCHAQRDARCGARGPPVLEALRAAGAAAALACSHVGGHEFAANVMAYPPGDCYGLVWPSDAPALVAFHTRFAERLRALGSPAAAEAELASARLYDAWRARCGCGKEDATQEAANACARRGIAQRSGDADATERGVHGAFS
jgi:hypothetical protein